MAAASPKLGSDDRRIDARTPVNRAAVLRLADQAYPIQVENLTRDGCKITTALDLAPGLVVTLGLAGVGTTTARIVWRSASGYGCMFEESLAPGAVTAALRNNVAYLDEPTLDHPIVTARDVKWSPRARVALIAGVTSLLWAVPITGVLLLLR